jgi:hypothetical protein
VTAPVPASACADCGTATVSLREAATVSLREAATVSLREAATVSLREAAPWCPRCEAGLDAFEPGRRRPELGWS